MCYNANSSPVDASPWSDPKMPTVMSPQPRMLYPPRTQTHSYARLPPSPWRGEGREWALGRTVMPLLQLRHSEKAHLRENGRGSAPHSHSRCIGDPGGQPGWPHAGPATGRYCRPAQLSPGLTGGGGGGIAGETSIPRPPPPRPRPPLAP